MRRLPLLVLAGLAAAALAACGGSPPPQTAPQPNADSIAAAERAEADRRAREEADARAREEAERIARQRAADSLAAMGRTTEAVRTMLATMIHFDFDKSNIRPDDAGVLDQKISILQANPNCGSGSPGTATSAGRTSTTSRSATGAPPRRSSTS